MADAFEQGAEQGAEQEKTTIAKNLKKLGISNSDISKATGLSVQELESFLEY